MEETSASIEALYEKAQAYINTNIELAKLKATDKISGAIASLVPRLLVVLFVLMFIFTANIALSLWLGDLLGKAYYGFSVVAAFYIVIALLIHFALHNGIKRKIREAIVEHLLN